MSRADRALRKLAASVADWKGPGWTHQEPLPSKEGYDIVLRRGDGGEALDEGESELRDHLRSYGRYLEAMHRANTYSPADSARLQYDEWGSPEHLRRVGGGHEGIDFESRDELPSRSYLVGLVRRGGGGVDAPVEREYEGKLNDYWKYLSAARDVTRRANRMWDDEIERDFPNIEVERKG